MPIGRVDGEAFARTLGTRWGLMLGLVPPKEVVARLRRDYNDGTARMVFGDGPAFADIMKRIAELEKVINS